MKSEGFWLNLHNGNWLEIRDHAMAVKEAPERFGLLAHDVRGLTPSLPHDHDTLRVLALRAGWLRIRSSTRGEVSAEFWSSTTKDAVRTLVFFLRRQGFGELTWVSIKNLKSCTGCAGILRTFSSREEKPRFDELDAASKRTRRVLIGRIETGSKHPNGRPRHPTSGPSSSRN